MKKLILFFILGIICLNLNSCSGGGDDSDNEDIADYDFDNDGYHSDKDCNDKDSSIHPGAAEIACDNTDQDCDGSDSCTSPQPDENDSEIADSDKDGYDSDSDCNDNDADIHPGAIEISCDNTDQDCDGSDSCTTTEPVSCIDDLNNWKISFEPHNSDCTDCHTSCVPDRHHTFCAEGGPWNRTESQCLACHRSVHN